MHTGHTNLVPKVAQDSKEKSQEMAAQSLTAKKKITANVNGGPFRPPLFLGLNRVILVAFLL